MVKNIPDLAIIGAGSAALSAAIYAARAGLNVQVFERKNIGGLLSEIPDLANYPGFRGPGDELARQMREQAEQLDVQILYGECTDVQLAQSAFELTIDDELSQARSVLVATGSNPKRLSFEVDRPVSYCALCDGPLAQGKHVAVIGGANSAAISALYLANLASQVTIITHSRLKSTAILSQQLRQTPNITIIEDTEPTPDLLEQFDYIFVYIGNTPATAPLLPLSRKFQNLLDSSGYVITGDSAKPSLSSSDKNNHEKYLSPHAAIIPGLFAAGDVRAGSVRQVVTAAGDGAAAAIEITDFLNTLRGSA